MTKLGTCGVAECGTTTPNSTSCGVIIIACGWFLVLKLNKAKPRWRAVFLLIIGFGAGLYIGIETTAEGYLNLPLGVLEKQLHELWGLPI